MYPELPQSPYDVQPEPYGEYPQQPTPEQEPEGFDWRSHAAAIVSWVVLPLSLVAILHLFVFQAYRVSGSSMLPTLEDQEYLIVSKVAPSKARLSGVFGGDKNSFLPERGDIIVFHPPREPSTTYVKRVVGLPGDRVVIRNGQVAVYNDQYPAGFNPDTSYLKEGTFTLIETDEVVDPGKVFVIGDNRTPGGSFDSREWGQLPSDNIIGSAVVRLLPLDKAKAL